VSDGHFIPVALTESNARYMEATIYFNLDNLKLVNDETMGEQICKTCGQVLVKNMADQTFEKYSEDFENSRTGPKISKTMHDGGLSTVIGKSNFDSSHKPVSSSMKGSLNRMRIWDSRSKVNTTSKKNLIIALLEISKLKEKMSLSDGIIERSAYLYRKAAEKQLVRGRSVRAVVGACLYAACRDYETTRTIIEISKYMNEKRRSIAQSYRMLFQELNLKVSVPDSTNSIIRFSNNLDRESSLKKEKFIKEALEITKDQSMKIQGIVHKIDQDLKLFTQHAMSIQQELQQAMSKK